MICNLKKEKLIIRKNAYGARLTVMLSMDELLKLDGIYGPRGEFKRFVDTVKKEAKWRECNVVIFNVDGKIGDYHKGEQSKYWAPPFAG